MSILDRLIGRPPPAAMPQLFPGEPGIHGADTMVPAGDYRNPKGQTVDRPFLKAGPDQLFRASTGPDWAIAPPEWSPDIYTSGLQSGRTVQVAANYGLGGGAQEKYRNKWDNIKMLDAQGNFPTSIPQLPQYNALPPQASYGLTVLTSKQYAAYRTATRNYSIPLPVSFGPPGPATLIPTFGR